LLKTLVALKKAKKKLITGREAAASRRALFASSGVGPFSTPACLCQSDISIWHEQDNAILRRESASIHIQVFMRMLFF
jgi:hypothetical protein